MQRTVNYNAGESLNQPVALHLITTSHNPRQPLRKLQEAGFDPMVFCHQYGLSDDPVKRKHFVDIIRQTQPDIEQLGYSLAVKQIQSVLLRDFRTKVGGEYETRYGIACGERRFVACVFMQAVTDKPFPVNAVVRKMTVEEAYWLGVQENLMREDMTEVEKGQIFHNFAEAHTVKDGEVVARGASDDPLPMTAVAKHFNVEYHYARGRAALATKLPADRLALYVIGKLNLTDAIREALGEPAHQSRPPRPHRRTPLTIRELEALFDETPRVQRVKLEVLAQVMRLDLTTALDESDDRLEKKTRKAS